MYVYFDVNGNLKEIVNLPVREGSVKANTIYVYVEPVSNPQPVNNIFSLPQRFTNAKINFKDDGGNNINPNGGNSVPMVKLTGDNAVQIPFDSKKDIYFFKYGFKYEMWSVELPSTVTSVNGLVSATAYLYNLSEQLALNTFSFNIEASVGVKPDRTMSEAQYSYLYNKISFIETADYVPYTGADKNVNLGSHDITARDVKATGSVSIQNGITALATFGADKLIFIKTGVYTINYPTENGTLATREWVQSQKPSKNVIGTFNTSNFAVPSGADYYKIDNISLSGQLGVLITITWGNAFAICPVPSLMNAKGEQLVDTKFDAYLINSGADVYGEYGLLGDWRENELYSTAGCDVYLYGNNNYHKRYENGVIEIIEVYEDGGRTYTKVGVTWHLDDYAVNLCPGFDGSYDIEDEEVWERVVKREGHVVGSLIGNDGYAKVVRVKYEITDNDSKLSITTDSSFTPPANYTGYVINYKII